METFSFAHIFFSHFQIIHMLEEIIILSIHVYEQFDFRNKDGGCVSVCVAPRD